MGHTRALVGRWLNSVQSEVCAEVFPDMRVKFNGWGGLLQLDAQDSIRIAWDSAGWCSVGTLRGLVIAWSNGSEWVHIMPAEDATHGTISDIRSH